MVHFYLILKYFKKNLIIFHSKSQKALDLHRDNLEEALNWLILLNNEPTPVASATFTTTPSSTSPETSATPISNPVLNSVVTVDMVKSSLSLKSPQTITKAAQDEEEEANRGVNSLRCDDCGVLLKDEDYATAHAHKTGHVNFSQSNEAIKPLTKEQIEEKKKQLAEKLVRIRKEKQEKERQDAIEQEKSRRKQGREINEYKQKFQEDEMKRIAEQRRREKIADREHK
jgi:hypothetical protein